MNVEYLCSSAVLFGKGALVATEKADNIALALQKFNVKVSKVT